MTKGFDLKDRYDLFEPDYYLRAFSEFPQRLWHRRRLEKVIKSIGEVKSRRILDIGGNIGIFASHLQDLGAEAVVLDISKSIITYGKNMFPSVEFVVGDGQKLPFKDECMDRIVCLETLEHVPRPWRICEEAYRALKRQGEFLAIVPNDDSILLKIVWKIWTATLGRRWKGLHVHIFSPLGTRYLLSDFNEVTNDELFHNMLCVVTGKKT